MATEARRQLFRIVPNYARLGATLLIGVALTRLQFAWLGRDGFGLIALLGATLGLGSIFQDLTRQSLIRELGAAYRRDGDDFLHTYNSSYILCAVSTLLAALAFTGIIIAAPQLKITDELLTPARWLVGGEGVSILLMILLAPAMNMYVVSERFITHNLFTTLRRANYLIAASAIYFGLHITDPARGVTLFGLIPAAMNSALLLIFVAAIMLRDRRLIPRFRLMNRSILREIAGAFGWNSAVILAISLHERVAALIMNLAFGLWGSSVFGLALRLVSYIRMGTMGMTFGVDAVSARIESEGDLQRMRQLVRHSTRLHALVAIPSAIAVYWLAQPLFTLWVGRFVKDPAGTLPQAVLLVRIMLVGLTARAISDGWGRILYGAGHIRKYAPLVLIGGLTNPILAVGLLLTLPDQYRYTAVGWGYTVVFAVVHFTALPIIGARALNISTRDFFAPLVRPTLAALVSFPVLLAVMNAAEKQGWSLGWLALAPGAYGTCYATLCAIFVLTNAERRRLFRALH